MPLLAYNLTAADVTLAAGNPVRDIPLSASPPTRGPAVNVTGELRPDIVTIDPINGVVGGLLAADFVLLQAQVASGDLEFEWTSSPEYLTGALVLSDTAAFEEIRCKAGSRVLHPVDTGLQTTDGGSLANDLYDVDYAAGRLMVGFVTESIAAGNNVVLIGAGSGAIPCYELNGSAGVVITADSTDKELALCAILVSGAVTLVGVLGAEAGTGTAVAPTNAEIKTALGLAAIANHDTTCGLIVARILFIRGAGGPGTTTCTHRNVSTYDALVEERSMGNLG